MENFVDELCVLARGFDPATNKRYKPVSRYIVVGSRLHQTVIYEVGWEPLLQAATPRGHPELSRGFSRLVATVWITEFNDLVIRNGHLWIEAAPQDLTPRRQIQALLGLRGDFTPIDQQLAQAHDQWLKVLALRADLFASRQ